MGEREWTEGHELAALERLFEIGLERLRAGGVVEIARARSLAESSTDTERDFIAALSTIPNMTIPRCRIDVAHVYRTVAERTSRAP